MAPEDDYAHTEEAILDSGIRIKKLYTPKDLAHLSYEKDIGEPGQFPFVRGIYPDMYWKKPWTRRLYAGFGNPAETNQRFRFLLEHGQTGLSLALDLPTQIGLNSDDPLAAADVGRVGVAIDTLKDMEEIFEGIDLGKISTSFTINATAAILLAMYVAVGEKQGVPSERLRGTVQNDILKEYIARGQYIFPPKPSIKIAGDIIEYCIHHIPRLNSISVAGSHMHENGATSVQQVAYTFSDALAYIDEVMRRGYRIDQFAQNISFLFCSRQNMFEDICTYRAARKRWSHIMKNRLQAKDPRSWILKFAAGGGGLWMTKRQPLNNIARATIVALASALGGAQSVLLAAYDEPFAIPTEETARISLNIQNILIHEVGLTDTIDPLGGSYFIESLTNEIDRKIVETMDWVEKNGGIVSLIEKGDIQRQLAQQAMQEEMRIQKGESVLVGVNRFVAEEEKGEEEMTFHEPDPMTRQRQIDRLDQVKRERDAQGVASALADLRKAAQDGENLMPSLIQAVKAYATLGEMVRVLKEIYGTYTAPSGI
ncbi:MAG: methylmalonyl-CoA mutase [Deltaproteobacteria bacterium]|nr:methylmalonyl-CoA mutase [Deltaproteobacteria bacterium]